MDTRVQRGETLVVVVVVVVVLVADGLSCIARLFGVNTRWQLSNAERFESAIQPGRRSPQANPGRRRLG